MNSEQGITIDGFGDRLRKAKLAKVTQAVNLEWNSWSQVRSGWQSPRGSPSITSSFLTEFTSPSLPLDSNS